MGVQLDKGISGFLTGKNSAPWCMYQVHGLPALWQTSGSGRTRRSGFLSGQNRGPKVRFWAAGCCRQACLPRYLRGADVRCRSVVRNTVRFFLCCADYSWVDVGELDLVAIGSVELGGLQAFGRKRAMVWLALGTLSWSTRAHSPMLVFIINPRLAVVIRDGRAVDWAGTGVELMW
jgi:hypothetical protein